MMLAASATMGEPLPMLQPASAATRRRLRSRSRASRPAVASAVFTVAAWVKVWPAALVGVLLVLRRGHRSGVLTGALTVTALVVLVDVLFGGAAHLLSFIGQQSGRALQIEAPLATPFMWAAAAHVPGAEAHLFDDEGHISLAARIGEILSDLKRLAGR